MKLTKLIARNEGVVFFNYKKRKSQRKYFSITLKGPISQVLSITFMYP